MTHYSKALWKMEAELKFEAAAPQIYASSILHPLPQSHNPTEHVLNHRHADIY